LSLCRRIYIFIMQLSFNLYHEDVLFVPLLIGKLMRIGA